MRYVCSSIISLCALVVSSQVHSQTDAPASLEASEAPTARATEPVQTMRKVSISATRGPNELIEIPATVTVTDATTIDSLLASDIRDLTRYEPGVSVSNASARFGLSGFNIRGIEGNRVAMRIDNIRMSDAFSIGSFSDARRNLVDLSMLKVAEIVRGPASALYGSDAIGGVVSFVTKDPADLLRGQPGYFRFKSDYQDENRGWKLGWTAAAGSDRFAVLFSYAHRENEETKNFGTTVRNDNLRTAPNPQAFDADNLLAKAVWNVNEQQALRLTAAYDRDVTETDVSSAQGRGAGAFASIFTVGLKGDDVQERTRVSIDHNIKSTTPLFDELEWRAYWQKTDIAQNSLEQRYTITAGIAGPQLNRDRNFLFEQTLVGAEIVSRKMISLGSIEHLFTYGLDFVRTNTEQLRDGVQTNTVTGVVTSVISPDSFPVRDFPNTVTRQYAAYVQDEMSLADGKVLVTPGVRVDYYSLKPENDAIFAADNPGVLVTGLNETSVTPKLGAIWNLTSTYSVYGNYARGFRAPPYADVNIGFTNLVFGYTAIANPDLKPETSNGFEIGFRGNYEQSYFTLTAFYNDYHDFISSLNAIGTQGVDIDIPGVTPGLLVFQSQNLVKAEIYGAEFRGGLQLSKEIKLISSIAYASGDGRATENSPRAPLNSVDPLKAVVGAVYTPSKKLSVELTGTAVDRHKHVNQSTAQFVPGGYFALDVRGHWVLAEHIDLYAGIFNLTDKKYWQWSDVRGVAPTSLVRDRSTQPGRSVSASIAIQF